MKQNTQDPLTRSLAVTVADEESPCGASPWPVSFANTHPRSLEAAPLINDDEWAGDPVCPPEATRRSPMRIEESALKLTGRT